MLRFPFWGGYRPVKKSKPLQKEPPIIYSSLNPFFSLICLFPSSPFLILLLQQLLKNDYEAQEKPPCGEHPDDVSSPGLPDREPLPHENEDITRSVFWCPQAGQESGFPSSMANNSFSKH